MKENIEYSFLTGYMTGEAFFWALMFAALGWFVYKVVTGAKRNKHSARSPKKWSWKFWFWDNLMEAFNHSAILFLLVRFTPDAVSFFWPERVDFFKHADHMLIYAVVGLFISVPLEMYKKSLIKKGEI